MSRGLKIITIIVILITLISIASVTYAWLSWSKDISLTSGSKCFDIAYSKEGDITGDLVPVDTPISDGYFTYKGGMALSTFTIKMNNSCTTPGDFTLTLKSTSIPSTYINGDSAGALKYALVYAPSVTIDSSYYVFAQGSINTTEDIIIYTGGITNDYNRTYTLIVYVDGNLAFDDAIGSSYSGSVKVDAVQKTSYDISGSLIDSSDNILTGYTIIIDNEITSTTDESGNYTLSSVPLGEHSIIVKDSSNNVITNSIFTLESSNNNSSNSSTIFVGSYRVQTLNIKLGSDNSIDSYKWSGLGNGVLPIEYRELEYLESSRHQYIDTGVLPTINLKTTIILYANQGYPLGTTKSQNIGYYGFNFFSGKSFELYFGTGSYPKVGNWIDGEIYDVVLNDSKKFYVNGTLLYDFSNSTNTYDFSGLSSIILFGLRYQGLSLSKQQILKVTMSGSEEHNFIPALRIEDSKPGMYDTVNGTFFTNLGTGEFGYETLDGTYVAPV